MKEHGQSGAHRIHAPDNASANQSTKNAREFSVSTFNVRTLRNTETETGPTISHKLQQLVVGCEKYDLDIVSLQEHRLHTENGEDLNFISNNLNGWTLAHTDSSQHSHGVALLYSKRIAQLLTNVEYKSDRIIAAHLQGNPRVCVISAYAPTEPSHDASKDGFYYDLENLIASLPPHTVVITAGDFNAHIGKDSHEMNPRVVGPNCYYPQSNTNGQRLVNLCEATNLRPAFSHFEDRRSRMATFHLPNTKLAPHQLDHILINRKWWKSIKNCRAYNSIDIGSDHKIVSANFSISFRVTKRPPNSRCKFNTDKLADPDIRKRFDLDIKNRFSVLFNEDAIACNNAADQIQQRADALDKALIETSTAILGKRIRRKQPHWVTAKTLELIEMQDDARKAHKSQPTANSKKRWLETQKMVSHALEKDQAANLNAQITDLVLAAQKREYGAVWKIIGYISDPPKPPIKVRKLDGSLPITKEELLAEWRE